MPGPRPKFKAFLTDEAGKRILEDENGKWVEFAPLWRDKFPDHNGCVTYSGRTGQGDQRLKLFTDEPFEEPEAPAPGGDTPF